MILSVDPSTTRSGWAVFNEGGSLEDFGHRVHKGALHERLGQLEALVYRIAYDRSCLILALESQFMGRNPKAGMTVGRAAGAVLCGFNRALRDGCGTDVGMVWEVSPTSVKHTCTGHGHASKERIAVAVERILGIEVENNDESDAIAIGLTYLRKRDENEQD